MWLRTTCDLQFDISVPAPFVLMLRPRSGAQQWIAAEEYIIDPNVPVFEFTDIYGNLCQRLIAQPGAFSVHTTARVMTADTIDQMPGAPFVDVQHLPDATLIYLLPSRYCEVDRFSQMAATIAGNSALGYDQVAAITQWLRNSIRFEPDRTGDLVSAIEVNMRQWGVCRDLSHLGIALCRSLCIPARMVVGYLYGLEPMDLHAWFEAYVGGRWYAFDSTQEVMRGGYIAIGYGRDAADVAVFNQFGPALIPTYQRVSVEHVKHAE